MATATYPPPPPYYKLYKDYLQNPKSAPEPPPPIQGTYMLYGATYTTDDVLPSLEEQGVRQLYPQGRNIDFKKELKALNRELQLHLLELADILIERPSHKDELLQRKSGYILCMPTFHDQFTSRNLVNRSHNGETSISLEKMDVGQEQNVRGSKFKRFLTFRRREEAQKLLKDALGTLEGQ
ncbi:hypothetical protein Cgig2_010013 [Carnegiea gigantea]|uniref:Mediator of RNA polymerase II transcription subunit 7 n=1 Tax=Carnegiea gigantea TaxID=171969 RepID=A0A9Q1Q457_9CARY|nr:hypothetical protein Cgig2_010013 [Carnegiea gigantea]